MRLRVLTVDDNRVDLLVLRQILQGLGCEVTEANDEYDAYRRLFDARDRPFDLLITDLQMGTPYSGVQLLRGARNLPYGQTTRRVLMSGPIPENTVKLVQALGVSDFILKPFHIPHVSELLKRLLAVTDIRPGLSYRRKRWGIQTLHLPCSLA